jgi:hypothetical protein
MALVYRTTGAWGAGKGSNLTAIEFDTNIWTLHGRIDALETTPPTPNEIANIELRGTSLFVIMDDATEFGGFEMPRPPARPSVVQNISGVSHNVVLADEFAYFRASNAAGCSLVLDLYSNIEFQVDSEISIRSGTAGPVVIVPPVGVTLNIPPGFVAQCAQQGAVMTVKNVAVDEWDVFGWLAEAATGTGSGS